MDVSFSGLLSFIEVSKSLDCCLSVKYNLVSQPNISIVIISNSGSCHRADRKWQVYSRRFVFFTPGDRVRNVDRDNRYIIWLEYDSWEEFLNECLGGVVTQTSRDFSAFMSWGFLNWLIVDDDKQENYLLSSNFKHIAIFWHVTIWHYYVTHNLT